MKIKPQTQAQQVGLPQRAPAKKAAPPAVAAQASKTWKPGGTTGAGASLHAAKKALTGFATQAAAKAIASAPTGPVTHKHPLLEKFGEKLGMGLGVIVTEALALVPSWNKPVLDAKGKPVASVEGAERVGNHNILKRHEEVVGPKVKALVEKLAPGAIHDLLEGLGKGASAAPGTSYRLEAAFSDMLHQK